MGSAISSFIAAVAGMVEREWASIKQLPGRQQQRIADRRLEDIKRKHPHLVISPQSKEERHASMVLPHVHSALRHYDSNNPGAEFDPVEPLMCERVGFRDEIWFHVNFLARPRKKNLSGSKTDDPPDTTVQHFFAELHYNRLDRVIVEACIILEKPLDRFAKKCAFCNGSYGILHPSSGEFVCGNNKAHKKEFYRTMYLFQRQFDHLPLVSQLLVFPFQIK